MMWRRGQTRIQLIPIEPEIADFEISHQKMSANERRLVFPLPSPNKFHLPHQPKQEEAARVSQAALPHRFGRHPPFT